MKNLKLGYNNLIDSATLSGGSWNASLPLANLQSRILSKVARATNALAASTLINIDLGGAKAVQAFGAIRTNISASGATYRLRGSNDNTFATSLYDSGTTSANAQTPDLILGLDSAVTARYWRLEIVDTSNVAGYVQIGRLFIGPALAPADNYSKGAEIGYQNNTAVSRSVGGVKYFDRKPGERVFSFKLDWMTEAEALGQTLELQKICGIDGEVLLVVDPSDTTYNQKRHFLGTLQQLSMIENPYLTNYQAAFNVVEVAA
ncbi:hypothetical protein [Methylomicrobium sp. Wu6]|uniref:hypothetical protein n=1 Tax=Methylomicrobium sp. Wu6 TaxID=3107928 RepID=UPI002DD62A06|nr:hypothetical protein [Methylomicrobium sp. Wu6]MEC4750055.1 hypothetical protein [Methylomicrobium sp. Wu6]